MRVLEKSLQMLKVTGFWIDKNEPRGFVYYVKKTLVHNVGLYAFYGIFYGLPLYMYQHSNKFSEVCESLGNAVGTALPTTMYLICVLKNDQLMELVQLLRNVDESYPPTNEQTKAIYENTKRWCWFWSVTFPRTGLVVFIFVAISASIDILLERDIEQRLKFVYPFDVTQPGALELAVFTYTCNFCYASYMTMGCNFMILCMFLNIIGQLRMLNSKVANLRSCAETEVRNQHEETEVERVVAETEIPKVEFVAVIDYNETSEGFLQSESNNKDGEYKNLEESKIRIKMQDLLKECIAHHCELLKCLLSRFLRAFEEYWDAFLSMNVIVCLAQSVLILTSSAMKDGSSNLVIHFAIAGTYYSMLGIFCYLSQQVTVESERLHESIYGCGWTDSSKNFKKSIGIMVSMTNQPIVIKAAGFIPLSLYTFKGVLNSAYSYYMVLSSI